MFSLHLFNVCVVFLLAKLWVLSSFTLIDTINNALAILILNSLHSMGSKFFLKFIYSGNAVITNDADYLKIDMSLH